MKKFGMLALTVILVLSLCACGRRDNRNPTTEPTTIAPTTTPATTAPATTAPATTEAPTVMPDIPDMETNIPDPTVNDNSTDGTTDTTQENARSRIRNRGN